MQRHALKPIFDLQKRYKDVYDQKVKQYKEDLKNKEEDATKPYLQQVICK